MTKGNILTMNTNEDVCSLPSNTAGEKCMDIYNANHSTKKQTVNQQQQLYIASTLPIPDFH